MLRTLSFTLFVATVSTGCLYDRQSYRSYPDGSYRVKVSLTTFMLSATAAGMRSEWTADKSGMIYGDSMTNVNTAPDSESLEAISAGIARGAVEGIMK